MTLKKELLWAPGAIGPALAAALGWICCLPLLGGAVGAIAGGLGTAFMPLRPYLMGAAVLSLSAGFYHAYRPAPACGPDGECVAPVSRTRQRVVLWISAFLVLALLTVQSWSSWVIYWTL
ncbi:MAG: mercuric transporter MerT family protein [Acidobacteriota bacterium]